MTIIPFLVLTLTAGPPPDYPAEAVLAAFSEACQESSNPEAAKNIAVSSGWVEFVPDETTPFGRLVIGGRRAIADIPNVKDLGASNFERRLEGRTLYLALSAIEANGKNAFGCRLYDFEATQPIPKDILTHWAGREPTSFDELQGMVNVAWRPGLNRGEQETAIVFAPTGSLLEQKFGLRGLSFRIQKLERSNP